MFCYQCQEAAKNSGCTLGGVCGKTSDTSNLMDLLIYNLKGLSLIEENRKDDFSLETGRLICDSLFMTITNANFDNLRLEKAVSEVIKQKQLRQSENNIDTSVLHDACAWQKSKEEYSTEASQVGILTTKNDDIRSLHELMIYGLKGIAAYAHHANILGKEDVTIYEFAVKALASTLKELPVDDLVALVLECGEVAVKTLALLDSANTEKFGNPEVSEVKLGVRDKPGILVSGHDLQDLVELLEQTKDEGIDVYTHSEMLPAHYYPELKKYDHLIGNYGNAWWKQGEEFDSFNGPILMTTNCITPVQTGYKDRIFTTGTAGYPDVPHIPDRVYGKAKDFSKIIELAKSCRPPKEIESGTITGGFAHNQVMELADTVVEAVKSGAIKRFVVMAGCDGRHKDRNYFTDVARGLPKDTVILTAGCAKYRYNKLGLGDINGVPRVLDAGQCNDSYSLAVTALKLQEVFELADINDLPISYDIAWYEQKAVAVLLALLSLGVKGIRLGPTLPAFLSPGVAKVLVETFDIKQIDSVESDIASIMAGK